MKLERINGPGRPVRIMNARKETIDEYGCGWRRSDRIDINFTVQGELNFDGRFGIDVHTGVSQGCVIYSETLWQLVVTRFQSSSLGIRPYLGSCTEALLNFQWQGQKGRQVRLPVSVSNDLSLFAGDTNRVLLGRSAFTEISYMFHCRKIDRPVISKRADPPGAGVDPRRPDFEGSHYFFRYEDPGIL